MNVDLSGVVKTMVLLFVYVVMGFLLTKKGIIDKRVREGLTAMVVQVTCPAVIVSSVCNMSGGDKGTVLFIFLYGIALYLALALLSFLAVKGMRVKDRKKEGMLQVLLIFSNVSFMGFPVLQAFYPDISIFYSTMLHLPFNIFLFTYGVRLLGGGEKRESRLRFKDIFTLNVIASLLAMFIYFLQLPVPELVGDTLSQIGSLTTPLSMIVIGSTLAGISAREVLTDRSIYLVSAAKLAVWPVLGFFVTSLLFEDPLIVGVATLTLGMPSGTLPVMVAEEYKGDVKTGVIGTVVTTMISLVTLPVLYLVFLA